jgi:hypothetical protein
MKRQTKDAVATRLWRVEGEGALLGRPTERGYNVFDLFLLLVLAIVIEDD